ncbi:MAG: chitobiase/beta-hexosaminidase C-terminal domain-containing protein, partial [Exilispira sp.]
MILPGGEYSTVQFVKITCATEGAKIYFTTDGTIPTTSSAQYTNPSGVFILGGTLKAIAVKDGYENSDIASANYTINYGTLTNKYPWTRFLGETDDDEVKDMVMSSDGYIYLVGQTKNSIANNGETNKGGYDIFIAKYSYNGTPIWIRTRGGTATDCANAL